MRAKAAGFDLVEIIACTGYPDQPVFFIADYESPDGQYGGALGKPDCAFGLEVIKKSGKPSGMTWPSGSAFQAPTSSEGGSDQSGRVPFLQRSGKAGIMLSMSPAAGTKRMFPAHLRCPAGGLCLSGKGDQGQGGYSCLWPRPAGDPVMAEKVLRSGAADMICVARPLLAVPRLPRKVKEGRVD